MCFKVLQRDCFADVMGLANKPQSGSNKKKKQASICFHKG